jgi:hypothetical protein
MPDHTDIPLEQLLIYDGDELLFDGSDPSTYIVLDPDAPITDWVAALGWDREPGSATDG